MSILVTGATGFVMANLVRHLAAQGHRVVAADRVPPDDLLKRFVGGLPGDVEFATLDVTDPSAIRSVTRAARPERVVHGAAITSVPPDAERGRFVETVDVNVVGTLHVLDALHDAGAARIVVVSSGSVYGSRDHLRPIAEDDTKEPVGVYPWSKWAGESFARRFADVRGLNLAVTRLASPFGPLERDTGSRPLLSPLAYWALAALRGQPIHVAGPKAFMRDAVYAEDIASGITAVLMADRLPYDIYNVGWGRGTSAEDAVAALTRLVPGVKVDFAPDETSPWGYTVRGPLAVDRLRELGWAPRYDLDAGLRAYLDWIRTEKLA
jgi:nucleoside-diphosphate-sugar epimerase